MVDFVAVDETVNHHCLSLFISHFLLLLMIQYCAAYLDILDKTRFHSLYAETTIKVTHLYTQHTKAHRHEYIRILFDCFFNGSVTTLKNNSNMTTYR